MSSKEEWDVRDDEESHGGDERPTSNDRPDFFRTESEMLRYALKLSMETASAEMSTKETEDEETTTRVREESPEESPPGTLHRTLSVRPPTVSSQYSYSSTERIRKDEKKKDEDIRPVNKVLSFYRSQSMAPSPRRSNDKETTEDLSRVTSSDDGSFRTNVFAWGRNDAVMMKLFSSADAERPVVSAPSVVPSLSDMRVVDASIHDTHMLACNDSGQLIGCGNNDEGQVLPGSDAASDVVDKPRHLTWEINLKGGTVHQTACGQRHSACVTRDGKLFTWGANDKYQLGTSDPSQSTSTSERAALYGDSETAWQVACGESSTCVLTDAGAVYSTTAYRRHLHDAAQQSRDDFPGRVRGLSAVPVVWISSGHAHCVAVTVDGDVYGWGMNQYGQLGLETRKTNAKGKDFAKEPTRICFADDDEGQRRRVTFAVCGGQHTCFVDASSRVLTCGRNHRGQLGRTGPSCPPTVVPALKDRSVMRVSAGTNHNLCLCVGRDNLVEQNKAKRELMLYAWGDNRYGQVGVGSSERKIPEPQLVPSASFRNLRVFNIAAGGDRSVAIAIGPKSSSWAYHLRGRNVTLRSLITNCTADLSNAIDAFEIGSRGATRKLLRHLEDVFGSLVSLNMSFVVRSSSTDGSDIETSPVGLESFQYDFEGVCKIVDRIPRSLKDKFTKTVSKTVQQLTDCAAELDREEQLRGVLALLLICGTLYRTQKSRRHLLDGVLACMPKLLNRQGHNGETPMSTLARMAINAISAKEIESRVIRPVVDAFDCYFSTQSRSRDHVARWMATAAFLNDLWVHNKQRRDKLTRVTYALTRTAVVDFTAFVSKRTSSLPDRDLFEEFRRWRSGQNVFSLLKFSFLLDASSKRRVLQFEARMDMMQRGRNAIFQSLFTRQASPYFVLVVRRDHVLSDTLSKINAVLQTQMQQEMKKELKVVFQGEDGKYPHLSPTLFAR